MKLAHIFGASPKNLQLAQRIKYAGIACELDVATLVCKTAADKLKAKELMRELNLSIDARLPVIVRS